MKKIYKNGLFMFAAAALAVSCADYNVTDGFKADPDPTVTTPFTEYGAVKSYIDRTANPNLTIGTTLDIKEFNKQELAHSAAMANFDNVCFGTTLMSGSIVSDKGVMNFIQLNDLLEHMDEIGGVIYGSPIVANTKQADKWLELLTSPIEIVVEYVEGKAVNFNEFAVGAYSGTNKNAKALATIKKYDNQNTLNIPSQGKVNIVEGFEVDPSATYTATFWVKSDKDASFFVNFSGNKVAGTATSDGKWKVGSGKWTKVVVESKAAADVTEGYLEIEMVRGSAMNVQKVDVGYYPDNHRPQTEKERTDTIKYALNAWCDGLMKINKGRIKTFDLIDEPIDVNAELENGKYDLKHSSTTQIYWQDIIGSEQYAPVVDKVARQAFEKYNGDPAALKFFISESGLEDTKKMESLLYWIGIWDNNGAKIDGINAKLNLVYYEDQALQTTNKQAYETLLANLAKSGKLVRVSNFDVKYVDASGTAVAAKAITDEQRQKLAEYNAYAIKAYMQKIPSDKQAGICKANMVDTNDPVGLWSKDSKKNDYVRSATYKAWCEALGNK